MNLFCYCYHILFVLLFTAALSVCFMTCGMTKNRVFLRFGELLFAYILEAIFLAVVEFCAALDLAVSGGPEPLFHVVLEFFPPRRFTCPAAPSARCLTGRTGDCSARSP